MTKRLPDQGPRPHGAGEGRSTPGRRRQVTVHLSPDALAALQTAAKKTGGNRSAALNELLTKVVAPIQRAQAKDPDAVGAVVFQTDPERGHVRHLKDL